MKAALLKPVPLWARCLLLLALAACVYLFGFMAGERHAGERHIDYVTAQAAQAVKVAKAQIQVLVKTETKYRDRIKTVYLKGETIERSIPAFVTAGDSERCSISAGFVRVYNAAWTGSPAGPPAESDRGPTAVSLAELAGVDAHNAASCLAWREQAVGLRELYRNMQAVSRGETPTEAAP